MKRTLFALAAAVGLVGFAVTADAATLSVTTDQTSYNIGDTITLTVTGNSQGNTAGDQAFVIIRNDLLVTGLGGTSQAFTQFGSDATVGGNQGKCEWEPARVDQCLIYDQLFGIAAAPADAGDRTGIFTYTADIAGISSFTFEDVTGADFIFFNLGNSSDSGTAPGGVTVTIVPEPTTAVLLGLGLFGLTLAGRRRS